MSGPAVIELRQYLTKPGRRDVLIALFERRFVESQEALGITLIGQFRDLDRPDHFVWLRGFADMDARRAALEAFYDGLVWRAHREAANATLLDNDDVLLLRPSAAEADLALPPRQPFGARLAGDGLVTVTVQTLAPALPARFEAEVRPALEAAGARVLGWMVSETSPNSYPRLPVREGEPVLVWIGAFADIAAQAEHRARTEGLESGVLQRLRLAPTARSRLRA